MNWQLNFDSMAGFALPHDREERGFGCSFFQAGKTKTIKDIILHREFTLKTRKVLKIKEFTWDSQIGLRCDAAAIFWLLWQIFS